MHPKLLLNAHQIDILLHRLACQLIEKHRDFSETVLIGLQPRGSFVLDRLIQLLSTHYGVSEIAHGKLDTTFFRDDFRRTDKPHAANATQMNVSIEDKSYGRPSEIELLTFIDRRFSRHLPIQPDYVGRQIDSLQNDKVEVKWKELTDEDAVYLIKETL
jgi:pyrimidine operon attenuation protein/uracil phosphoribosyltransferase